MFKTIKGKVMTSITVIVVSLMGLLFLFINRTLSDNLENMVRNDIGNAKGSVEDIIKNYYIMEGLTPKENQLRDIGWNILYSVENGTAGRVTFIDNSGNLIIESESKKIFDLENKYIIRENQGEKVLLHLEYINNNLIGVMNYAFYIEGKFLGTIVVEKNYKELYEITKTNMNMIVGSMVVAVIIILMLVYFILNKIMKPLEKLSSAMKGVSKGDYAVSIKASGKDEISELTSSFLNMKEEIETKINTIKDEKDKVYKLSQSRKQFFDSATHELKTPLTAISGYAQILVDDVEDDVFKKRASERILLESNRLHKLVCNLLSTSQEKSSIEKKEEAIFIDTVIDEVIGDFRKKIDENGVLIYIKLNRVETITIKDNLTRIIINLIDNAIKYSSDSKAYIELKEEETMAIVHVINKCNKIPKKILDNIFEPFTKFNYGQDKIPSTGLGLYISKELSKEISSDLNVSLKDMNLTFELRIPIK